MFIILLVASYLSGALPWSVWLGRRFFQRDPRSVADGNPGAANAYRIGGLRLGIIVALLDFCKAFVPVLFAQWRMQLPPEQVFWVALMPTLGHAFSIFLGFRGGRALAVLFGVWAGLTFYEVPLVMGAAAFTAVLLFKKAEWQTLAVPLVLIGYLLLRGAPPWMLLLALVQLLILLSKLIPHLWAARFASSPAD